MLHIYRGNDGKTEIGFNVLLTVVLLYLYCYLIKPKKMLNSQKLEAKIGELKKKQRNYVYQSAAWKDIEKKIKETEAARKKAEKDEWLAQ